MMTSEEKAAFSHEEQLTLMQIRSKKWTQKPGAEGRRKLLQVQEEERTKAFLKTVKACPQCKVPFQKVSGCDHITCTLCKHQFCMKCGGDYPKVCDTGTCQLARSRMAR